jgi:hypothetical protein
LKVLFEAEVIQQEFLDPDLRYSGYDPEEGNGPALAISSAPYLLFVVGARASCIALARF